MLSMALAGVGWFSLFDSGVSGERCHSYTVIYCIGLQRPWRVAALSGGGWDNWREWRSLSCRYI